MEFCFPYPLAGRLDPGKGFAQRRPRFVRSPLPDQCLRKD
jgi:hypothetical protein